MKHITLWVVLLHSTACFLSALADREFRSKNGQVIEGSIIKSFEDGDVLLKRTSDMQLFRISCLLYTSPSPRDATLSRMPSSA